MFWRIWVECVRTTLELLRNSRLDASSWWVWVDAGHDSPYWVVTKLVSEPRLEMYDLGCLIVVDCVSFLTTAAKIRFRHVFDQSSLFEYYA